MRITPELTGSAAVSRDIGAKENAIATLGVLYGVGDEGLRAGGPLTVIPIVHFHYGAGVFRQPRRESRPLEQQQIMG